MVLNLVKERWAVGWTHSSQARRLSAHPWGRGVETDSNQWGHACWRTPRQQTWMRPLSVSGVSEWQTPSGDAKGSPPEVEDGPRNAGWPARSGCGVGAGVWHKAEAFGGSALGGGQFGPGCPVLIHPWGGVAVQRMSLA